MIVGILTYCTEETLYRPKEKQKRLTETFFHGGIRTYQRKIYQARTTPFTMDSYTTDSMFTWYGIQ